MKLIKSFRWAVSGIVTTIKSERNMRIHLAAAFYVYLLSLFYDFSGAEYAMLTLAVGIVLFAEMVNTAFERYVDHDTHDIEEYARVAKDTAAGAVLVSAIVAIVVGLCLFWDIPTLRSVVDYFAAQPMQLVWVIATMLLWLVFIFKPRWQRKQERELNGSDEPKSE